MSATSPAGTKSKLLYPRPIDRLTNFKNLTNWTVTSLHYWGEEPRGDWNITITNMKPVWNRKDGTEFIKLTLFHDTL